MAGRPASPSRDGTEFYADTVVSSLDPRRTFLELVNPRELPDDLVENIQRFRFQGTSSKVNFALDGLPEYPTLPGRGDIFRGFMNVGPSIDYLERAFDEGKYGWYSSRPYIDGAIQSDHRSGHGTPRQARHVVLHPLHAVPPARERLGHREGEPGRHRPADARVVLPGLLATSCSSARSAPRSTSSGRSACREGNIFAGEFFAPQMFFFRPAPGWSQYRTPIDGYYQCGSGTHPGGCVTGGPGRLAASQIFKDRAKAGLA